MELTYSFLGVQCANDGTYPRAKVLVTCAENAVPTGAAIPRIEIVLPLTTAYLAGARYQAIGESALHTARQLVHEQALRDWVAAQQAAAE